MINDIHFVLAPIHSDTALQPYLETIVLKISLHKNGMKYPIFCLRETIMNYYPRNSDIL